jgi:hypothetical protein
VQFIHWLAWAFHLRYKVEHCAFLLQIFRVIWRLSVFSMEPKAKRKKQKATDLNV